jgi:predicted phage terminase large subunit-like protein
MSDLDLTDILDVLGAQGDPTIALDREQFAREGGYYHFFKAAWHTVEPSELIDEKYVRFLCDHMERLMRGQLSSSRLLINIPPSHSKSMILVVFALAWLWTIDPTAYSIFAHKDQPIARDMARKTRMVITSDWYQARWGDTVTLLDDATKIDRFGNTAGGGRVAVTVRQQITGSHAKGKFGGLIVLDDPNRPDETDLESANTERWYREVLPTRFGSLKTSQIAIVQQRISQRDISAYVLDTDENYVHVCLPMEYDPDRHCKTEVGEDWREEPGELLSPLRNSPETVARLKDVFGDPRIAEAQLNQDPVARDGALFSEKMFALRYHRPSYLEALPFADKPAKEFPHLWLPTRLEWTLSCDLTFTGAESSDFAVIQTWARCLRTDRHYLDDMIREKMGFIETANRLLALLQGKRKNATPLIEKAANGFAVIEVLEKAGITNVEEFSAGKKSKEARAAAVSWLLDDERVLFPEDPNYNFKEYVREMTGFPNMRRDDVVDATTMYLAFISGDNTPNLANAFRFAGDLARNLR